MRKSIIFVLFTATLCISNVYASCKSGETAGTSDPSDLTNRLFQFDPKTAADTNSYNSQQITVTSYNIQSGFSYSCSQNVQTQATQLVSSHYFASQEVDVNSTHCSCNQPQTIADITGKTALFLRTIYNQGGMYGSASGSVYPILEKRYQLFTYYSSELRGLIAQRTQPPQLQGRDLWIVSTHLQYDSVEIRTQQANELVTYLKALRNEFPEAVIIVPGDYYSQNGQSDYTELASFLTDSWVSFSGGYTGGSTYPANSPSSRYDYVWYNAPSDFPIKVTNFQILNVQYSDHRPIRVSFGFPALYSTTGTALPDSPRTSSASSVAVLGLTSVVVLAALLA